MHEQVITKTLESLGPPETALQFDLGFLAKVLKLERPGNMLQYRDVSLLCNTLCLLRLSQLYEEQQLEQRWVGRLYKRLSKFYGFEAKKSTIFLKEEHPKLGDCPCFGDAIAQARHELFFGQVLLEGAKAYLARLDRRGERYLLLGFELESTADPYRPTSFQVSRVNFRRFYMEPANLRKMKGRVDTLLATEMADFRKSSFVKSRAGLRKDYEETVARANAEVGAVKLPEVYRENAKHLLRDKLRVDCQQLALLSSAFEHLHAFGMLASKVELYGQVNFLDIMRESTPLLDELLLVRKVD